MAHTLQDKNRLLGRVRRMRGQVEALERALEKEADCNAVMQQIAAVRGAASGLMSDVLEEHLREHLNPRAGSIQERERGLIDAAAIVRRYLR